MIQHELIQLTASGCKSITWYLPGLVDRLDGERSQFPGPAQSSSAPVHFNRLWWRSSQLDEDSPATPAMHDEEW